MDGAALPAARADYEHDFHAWALEQGALLRAGRLSEADLEHLAEEIERLAKKVERGIRSRLRVLLAHLLKWEVQPDLRCRSWKSTIDEQREKLVGLFEDNPSLAARWDDHLKYAYPKAVGAASTDTGIVRDRFRLVSLWTREQILSEDFFPGDTLPMRD
jgi:hypothetical protein